MIDSVISKIEFRPLKNVQHFIALVLMILISVLLFYRDVSGGIVSKYLFCFLTIPYLLLASENNAFLFFGFLMPLYVGLPGNIILPFFLLRLIVQKFKIHKIHHTPAFLCTVFLMIFMFFQNYIYGYTSIYNMICIAELLVVYFVIYKEDKILLSPMISFYSIGVSLVGIIMLSAALKRVEFSQLLSVSSRLGDYQYSEGMSVNIDPNFYGLFAVTVLSVNWLLIQAGIYSRFQKIIAYISILCSLSVGLIGLSRSFILCLAIWAILVIVCEKRAGLKARVILLVAILIVAAFIFFPDVVSAVLFRFHGADIATGNGRIDLLQKYGSEWISSPNTVFFGIGLFVSEAHCMQAQFLFGIGLIGFIPLVLLGFYYFRDSLMRNKIDYRSVVPFVIIQLSAGMLPSARSLTYMMPVVISFLAMQAYYSFKFSEHI